MPDGTTNRGAGNRIALSLPRDNSKNFYHRSDPAEQRSASGPRPSLEARTVRGPGLMQKARLSFQTFSTPTCSTLPTVVLHLGLTSTYRASGADFKPTGGSMTSSSLLRSLGQER